ncbi:anaerobic ribonucleoside-triphosphate reductase [Sulfidibacter corallicola]|uniref:Uncharacterized protein n=1 Tax=Sulfidibacter corallicola TaxID=2818388 RepID=A0A8A4U2D8_SULCO|nr:anaerobic ribonucleoside-triphosphate reductase [Sulfidibacter corallicola]QTD52895.1 hypothetical protein J3U87_10495 [Sulfidibacter corallicola]
MVSVEKKQRKEARGNSSMHVDQLTESAMQSSLFRSMETEAQPVDFTRLRASLQKDSQIPREVIDRTLARVQDNLGLLGLEQPSPTLVLHWLTGLLRQEGYNLGDIPLQSLELSLSDVELNIYHPVGFGAGADQNPEATSQRIAQRIKAQFACRRIYQPEVVQAHDNGYLELLHLGAIDRPHDVFVTPDYLKQNGLPVMSGAPSAGPAKRADVLLAHLIRFTHELQNHFAGDIQWGYVNTLFLPFLTDMSDRELNQFIQQLFFEFGQLDLERGGLYRQIILDFDFDMPKQLMNLPALGPGGESTGKTYADYRQDLVRFNEVVLDILARGDFRGNPFHSPQIVYHLNDGKTPWDERHQRLMDVAFRVGNPRIAFSDIRRDFGALGHIYLNHPDFLKQIQVPSELRGFSLSSVALNLPTLTFGQEESVFWQGLEKSLDLAVTAHRQKRLFISRLMAYGNRGPLQFLRHKLGGQPFLKIDQATQPMHLIGLAEMAAYHRGSPQGPVEVLGAGVERVLQAIESDLTVRNRIHKLKMMLAGTKNESLSYRFAFLDLRRHPKTGTAYLLRDPEQAHPIYTEGPNILAFHPMAWRERFKIEGRLHRFFRGHHQTVLYHHGAGPEDTSLYQRIVQEARQAGVSQLQLAPDLAICMSCHFIFGAAPRNDNCPSCGSTMVSPYGYCHSSFSPVSSWCLGKRSEWKIRHRLDDYKVPVQQQLPW